MQKIMLLSAGEGCLPESLYESTEIIHVHSTEDALARVKEAPDISTVLVEYPSELTDIRTLIDYVSGGNNYIFSIAILLITDAAHLDADLAYLGGAAVDVVQKPVHPRILLNRIENAEELVSSVSFAEFARMLKVLPANIYLKDANGRYVFSSQTWHHLDTGDDPNWTIRGKTDLEIRKDRENAMLAYESDRRIIETGKGTSYIIKETDEGLEYLQLIKEPLFFENGRVRGIIALINNVTEQELLRRELKERSVRDQLTGLYNRSYLDEYITGLKAEAPYPITVISADCDRLKKVNDTYGHMIGDAYIRLCVTLMNEVLPENSCLFRMGGDEFLAFLPNTPAEDAEKLIERMQQTASSYAIKDVTLSVSLGYYTMEDANDSIADSIKRSDADMYRDKQRKKAARVE